MTNRSDAFSEIYESGGWGGRGSGGGSDPEGASPYVSFVLDYVKRHGITSVVDAGCGDWQMWPSDAFETTPTYLGIDVVESVVLANEVELGNQNRRFQLADIIEAELPDADLLLCKEVLQHLSNADVARFLASRVPQYPHVIICVDSSMRSTSALRRSVRRILPSLGGAPAPVNSDIDAGGYRPLDLSLPPFRSSQLQRAGSYDHVISGRCLTTKEIWTKAN